MLTMKCAPLIIASIVLLGSTSVVHAEEEPLWEAGLGIGAIVFSDYRGSDEARAYPIPLPYFVYRGDFLKADREGMRGELFNQKYVELSISLNATIPVESDDNDARAGMPDLDPTIEIGPSFDLHLWRSQDERVQIDLIMPLRMPVTIESSPKTIGWVFSPRLNLDVQNLHGSGWDLGLGAGPVFADRKYHDYFYSVNEQYATATRPEYEADGGYSGAHLIASLSKRFPKYWIGAFLRYDALHSAAFDDSPLFKREHYFAGGVGIAWMIGRSKRMVETR